MLSTDKNIFVEGSEVRQRMADYGGLVEELHIVIKTKNAKLKTQNFSNVFLYPTNTKINLFYFWDAYKISSGILRNLKLLARRSFSEGGEIRNCVITTQDPFETGWVGYLLKKKFKLPLQIQIHTDFLSPYFWRESLKNKVRVLMAQRLVKKANCLRVVSERIKNSLLSLYPKPHTLNPITVLPIVYDMDRFTNGSVKINLHTKYKKHEPIILMASRLTKEKNVGMAIKAMKDIITDYPKTLLLIVGDGPELDGLKLQVTSYKLQNYVIFESWTNDIISYYKTADFFILTSNYEGGARSPSEAIASGLPVIMTDVAPANEIVINNINGFVVPVGNSHILASRMIELIIDKKKCKEFAQYAL